MRHDPLRNFNFVVEIDSLRAGGFSECSGLSTTTEPQEINEGGLNSASHRLAGRSKESSITLKSGVTTSFVLYAWHRRIVDGRIERKDGSICVLDLEGNERCRWNFYRGWPSKWDGPAMSATGNEVAIESLEITHEGLERVKP
jgi:phage tail-like protein